MGQSRRLIRSIVRCRRCRWRSATPLRAGASTCTGPPGRRLARPGTCYGRRVEDLIARARIA